MIDREKVIKGLECCIRHGENAEVGCGRKDECPYEQNGLKCWLDLNRDALAMLKERETQKFFVDESGKITPLPVVVRCKDCKNVCMCDTSEIFPGISIYAKCTLTDKVHKPEWFCADGVKRDE